MKMFYGNTPVNSMKIKHYEMNTNDCTMVASDLQAGVTGVARGKKIVGTGKSFEFASYGGLETNDMIPVPANINVIEVACMNHPIQLSMELSNMKNVDFSVGQTVGNIIIENISYPLVVKVENNILTISCSQTTTLEVFYGKDNYA